MGASCISQTQHENKVSVNTDSPNPSIPTTPTTDLINNINKNNAKTVQSVHKQTHSATSIGISDTSEPYQINPNLSLNIIQNTNSSFPHHRNKNSLGSIDEYSAITDIRSNDYMIDSDQYQSIGPLLTHEALREHDIHCNIGIGIESISISSISDTDIDDDTLKQIGNQLLAMNINKKTSISIISNDRNNINQNSNNRLDQKQSMSQHVKKIKSNNKYKQYKPRQCIYTKSKKDNTSQYSRQSSSIWSLSETPQPNEFRIGADHHKYHHHQNTDIGNNVFKQKRKTDGKKEHLNHCYRDSEDEETETDGTSDADYETSMQFPDVYYFDNNNNKQRRKNRNISSSRYEINARIS